MSIKILLVDDHHIVTDGLKSIIAEIPDFQCIAEAANGKRGLELALSLEPDVILMDVDMPLMNGLEATRQIKLEKPNIGIIILSLHKEKALIQRMIEIGANGYLIKNSGKDELEMAIRKVANGEKYFSTDVTISLTQKQEKINNQFIHNSEKLALLTERELEILKLITEGFSNKEIGEKLFVSHRTVDTHRTNIMKKIEEHKIAGLIRFAIKNGLA